MRPKPDAAWRLPGGWARTSQPIAEVAARDLQKQTGVVRALTHVAVLGQGPASQAGGGHLVVVFAATLTDQETELLATSRTAGRLCAVPPDDLDDYALPYDARLVRAAVDAVRRGATLPLLPLDDLTPA